MAGQSSTIEVKGIQKKKTSKSIDIDSEKGHRVQNNNYMTIDERTLANYGAASLIEPGIDHS